MVQARVMFAVERATGAQGRGSGRGRTVRHATVRVGWRGKGNSHAHVRENAAQVRVSCGSIIRSQPDEIRVQLRPYFIFDIITGA